MEKTGFVDGKGSHIKGIKKNEDTKKKTLSHSTIIAVIQH